MQAIQWEYIFDPQLAWESLPFLIQGIPSTLGIALTSTAIGILIGLVLALMRLSGLKAVQWTARAYVSFMRGTPALVFLFLIYFGLPFAGIQFSALTAAIICFSLNAAAYISEIFRSSIASVDKGQWEAAAVLGLSPYRSVRRIILPQAIRIAIPPLSSVLLDVIKGTSLAAMITVNEIFQNARIVGGREHDYMTMYILVAGIYWLICSIFSVLQDYLEHVFSRYITG
ncbi:amino acid ABC transporter, permease protein [Alkalibacterium sp. AK22]|uniref:amino acid ABC transporter permease n=1 Tax=Alkalibacterium sp. AK22 TaxID=1229520 RepID=UPI00044EC7A1|nr:amino acid ABC transporter permease [Alkalibacterium sp. AK22]EXJ23645.1 amino acid ABC transporter, permease protein [Alkalibacterium sp. AK22]